MTPRRAPRARYLRRFAFALSSLVLLAAPAPALPAQAPIINGPPLRSPYGGVMR